MLLYICGVRAASRGKTPVLMRVAGGYDFILVLAAIIYIPWDPSVDALGKSLSMKLHRDQTHHLPLALYFRNSGLFGDPVQPHVCQATMGLGSSNSESWFSRRNRFTSRNSERVTGCLSFVNLTMTEIHVEPVRITPFRFVITTWRLTGFDYNTPKDVFGRSGTWQLLATLYMSNSINRPSCNDDRVGPAGAQSTGAERPNPNQIRFLRKCESGVGLASNDVRLIMSAIDRFHTTADYPYHQSLAMLHTGSSLSPPFQARPIIIDGWRGLSWAFFTPLNS